MTALRREPFWRPVRDVPFLVFSVAVVLGLVRSIDQPSVAISGAGTELSLVPTDAALAVLAVLVATRLLGSRSLPRPARAITYAAGAFSAWLLLSSLANGAEAAVGAAKLLEYGVLALGALLFVRRRIQFAFLVGLLVAVNAVALAWALGSFFDLPPLDGRAPGGRQSSFLGEHDFAALSTMSLALGLAALYAGRHRLGRLPLVGGVVGGLGLILSGALAGLLGLYLAAAAIAALALLRGTATRRALAVTAATAVVVTAGVLALRSDELGAFARFLGVSERQADQYENAASWSHRLVYAYVGGRVFLENPVLGTGWYGQLPPSEFARFVPDARARFADQPDNYFPRTDEGFLPQQTYDQILFSLGIVGALLFLTLALVTARAAAVVGRLWPVGDPDEPLAYLPAAWMCALAGGLAGAALFGGIPLAAIFWLTLGVVALAPSLVPPPQPGAVAEQPHGLAALR